jgi:thiol-disulfide isomerase/thioredoxin
MKKLYLLIVNLIALSTFAQLPESNFPQFNFQDLEGNTHNSQEYLGQGKVIVINVFATWCPNCTSAIPTVRELWEERGPEGDDSMAMLYAERDPNTSNEQSYINTHNIGIPVITEATQFIADLGITYQPVYIVVCPDGSYDTYLGSIGDGTVVTDMIDECAVNSIGEEEKIDLNYFSNRGQVIVSVNSTKKLEITLYNLVGRKVAETTLSPGENKWRKDGLEPGIYILRVGDESYKMVVP